MLDASIEFKIAIRKNSQCDLSGKINLANGTETTLQGKDFMANTTSFTNASSASGNFQIGAAVMGSFSTVLNNFDRKFDTFDFTNAIFHPVLSKQLSETKELIPKGIFTVEKPTNSGNTISITAYDNMKKFEKPYSEVNTSYPATLSRILNDVCTYCGVVLNTQTFDMNDFIIQERPDDSSMTCLDVVSYVAQIGGYFAVINVLGSLELRWYNSSSFADSIDGGTFNTETTPYSDGSVVNGGNFSDYTSGDSCDGGLFTDNIAYRIYSFQNKTIGTDEIIITGIRCVVDNDNSVEYGNKGYILEVKNNKLITETNMQSIVTHLGEKIVGLKFRQFSISTLSDPTLEPGDAVDLISDKNMYHSFITRATYKLGNYESLECSAETPSANNGVNYSATTKAISEANTNTKKQISAYDVQVQMLTNLMTNSFGVFKTEYKQGDGSIVYYMHNKPKLIDSSTIWKMTADAFSVSTDGGKTWNAGIDSSGNAIVNVLSAVGVNCNWLHGGEITGQTIKGAYGEFTKGFETKVPITINGKDYFFRIHGSSDNVYIGLESTESSDYEVSESFIKISPYGTGNLGMEIFNTNTIKITAREIDFNNASGGENGDVVFDKNITAKSDIYCEGNVWGTLKDSRGWTGDFYLTTSNGSTHVYVQGGIITNVVFS